jgi:CubicO group peptidase (beta-lactamase class C family)
MFAPSGVPMRRSHKILAALSLLLLGGIAVAYPRLHRVYSVIHLFDRKHIAENFRDMKATFDYRVVHKGDAVSRFQRSERPLPDSFTFEGKQVNVHDFLERTGTTGLIIIKDDTILHESYYRGNTASTQCISWSVGKSFVSALVGLAVSEGRIKSIHDPVTDYVPVLKSCGYDGVSIKDLMNMSSGIRFNEDYADFHSDINRMGRTIAFGTSMEKFILTLKRERPAGQFRHYVSMDTQVLGMLVRNVTGMSLSDYLEQEIWKKAGMEADAYWLLDSTGMELAFGTLNVTLRDFARFGVLYRDRGRMMNQQIIPEQWVEDSVTPDAPHLMPGKKLNSNSVFGYGYQWWIPPVPDGDFMAMGIYNQFIYVNPRRGIVIAKTSAHPDFNRNEDELASAAMFQTLARALGN